MSKAKHTPGEWTLDGLNVGVYGRGVVAVCLTPQAECSANARLIAAAPTMAAYIEKLAADGNAEAATIMEAINGSA